MFTIKILRASPGPLIEVAAYPDHWTQRLDLKYPITTAEIPVVIMQLRAAADALARIEAL